MADKGHPQVTQIPEPVFGLVQGLHGQRPFALPLFEFRAPQTVLDKFWAPVLTGSSPVSVCAAFVPVWNLDRDPKATGPARPEDYVELNDQFVGGGDLIATSRLAAMLTRIGRPYRIKLGNDVSFPDLRTGPAILVGYSYTRWREISSQMRYFIDASRRPIAGRRLRFRPLGLEIRLHFSRLDITVVVGVNCLPIPDLRRGLGRPI